PTAGTVGIDTNGILFICGGTFEGLEHLIAERKRRAGGNGHVRTPAPVKAADLTQDDLVAFGFMPEVSGRFSGIAGLEPLTERELPEIVTDKPHSPVRQSQLLLAQQGCDISFTPEACRAIARIAVQERAGARGIFRVVDRRMRDILFALPDLAVSRCVVGE